MPKAKERTDLASGLGVKNPGEAGMVVENPAGLENHPSAKRCHRLRGVLTAGRPMFMPQRFQLGQREMPQGGVQGVVLSRRLS